MTDRLSGYTIAVVDDDQRILESLQNLLESADYAVHSFASAAALLESDWLAEIDCLISDIDMSVMDGLELLRVVRAPRPELPVILITGHPELLNRLPPMGPSHYRLFKKPFADDVLLSAIRHAIERSHTALRLQAEIAALRGMTGGQDALYRLGSLRYTWTRRCVPLILGEDVHDRPPSRLRHRGGR